MSETPKNPDGSPIGTGVYVEREELRVGTGFIDLVTGDRLEPEEQPAQQILQTHSDAPATKRDLPEKGHVQNLPATRDFQINVVVERPALEMARAGSKACHSCAHFDERAFAEYRAKLERSTGGRETLREMATLAQHVHGVAKVVALDAARPGICHPMTEMSGQPSVVHPLRTCPKYLPINGVEQDGGEARPGKHRPEISFDKYEPKDAEAARRSSAAFDAVMLKALGKKPIRSRS